MKNVCNRSDKQEKNFGNAKLERFKIQEMNEVFFFLQEVIYLLNFQVYESNGIQKTNTSLQAEWYHSYYFRLEIPEL